jgi:hypothetical protein
MDLGLLLLHRVVDVHSIDRIQPQLLDSTDDYLPFRHRTPRYKETRRHASGTKNVQGKVCGSAHRFGRDILRPDFLDYRPDGCYVGYLYVNRRRLRLIHKRWNPIPVPTVDGCDCDEVYNTSF